MVGVCRTVYVLAYNLTVATEQGFVVGKHIPKSFLFWETGIALRVPGSRGVGQGPVCDLTSYVVMSRPGQILFSVTLNGCPRQRIRAAVVVCP